MTRSVEESWGLITSWLEQNLPAAHQALEPPASPAAIDAISKEVGRPLPADLLAWLDLTNGIRGPATFGNLLPPFYTPLICEGMLTRHRMMHSVYADLPHEDADSPAGSYSFVWLDTFLPLAASGTDVDLFVDLRDGELHGCVDELDATEGSTGPVWPSTAAMLSQVADAFVLGQPVQWAYGSGDSTEYRPQLEDGRLSWD
ncbi:SMI1/KNR4 family protein [Kribbella italica]|uniref:Cell wall assembly regulator SMI1 n=1 Tax=Kribbella italica TaxID=1540520 RepID=A0A7W9MYV6_9ACTN|nr:SMI1/KNR4 family protein [Kribbella italica]MBB5840782.1 cell wall assembly regulator SMI1 [Kribbella italica]